MLRPSVIVWLVLVSGLVVACAHRPPQTRSQEVDVSTAAARYAFKLVGAPYRYGGATPQGFDCSGLVHYSFGRAGVIVPRTTREQRRSSRRLSDARVRPGDLLFFTQNGKRASHVGLYIGDNQFVHAPSTGKSVHVSRLDNAYWRRHFVEARRFELD
ncbi:MAG: C40 family peptidase [Acidiferrobacterales bacterium]